MPSAVKTGKALFKAFQELPKRERALFDKARKEAEAEEIPDELKQLLRERIAAAEADPEGGMSLEEFREHVRKNWHA